MSGQDTRLDSKRKKMLMEKYYRKEEVDDDLKKREARAFSWPTVDSNHLVPTGFPHVQGYC